MFADCGSDVREACQREERRRRRMLKDREDGGEDQKQGNE